MSDSVSSSEEALDRWLAEQHHALVTDLSATLDLEAGLREAMIPARHANLIADLCDVLDVEAGLSAIVPDASVAVAQGTGIFEVLGATTRAPKAELRRPRVFLSFAGGDRVMAERLRQDLEKRDIEAFVFPPGGNLVLDINRALTQSDYFLLLWSQASVDRAWVDAEWSAAFARELQERRSFLFIARLDMTPLPPLLAPRRYLDAFDNNWDQFVNELASTCHQDGAVGEPVLPAPHSMLTESGDVERPSIDLYVRNRALSVAHVVAVPEESTGRELQRLVRSALALPDIAERFGGAVGMRFHYQLRNVDEPIPSDKTLVELHVTDGTTIELEVEVEVEAFGPTKSSPIIANRRGVSKDLSPAATQSLINSNFGHLIPW